MTACRTVCIYQYRLLHYRLPLFELLRDACLARGIELSVVYGQPTAAEAVKRDTSSLSWGHKVRNRWLRVGGIDLVWQPRPKELRSPDLVIVMQESRLVSNYSWLLWGWRRGTRVAYWGHGRNLQSNAPAGWRERWKQWWVGRADWWFAYTGATRELIVRDGYPPERITVLNNAIDNTSFESALAAVNAVEVRSARNRIDAAPAAPVGLYCGSLWAEKRLRLLVDAADRMVLARPDFRLVVLGDGPDAAIIRNAAQTRPWLYWMGARHGAEKALWFRVADAFLCPGAVGLHILDAFCAGLPFFTTDDARHGPEIAYLRHGENGISVPGDPVAFAEACLSLFADPSRQAELRTAARADALRYSLGHMAQNFMRGIEGALAAPPRRGHWTHW